jgi:ABC-2 type transport system permease protein
MKKFWKIFAHEYTRHVLRKRFLMGLLSIPMMMLAMVLFFIIATVLTFNTDPVGYIDQARILKTTRLPEEYQPLLARELLAFDDEAAARTALDQKKIQAFFVIPSGYPANQEVRLYYLKEPRVSIEPQLRTLIQINLLAGKPDEVIRQVINGPRLVTRVLQEEQQADISTFQTLYRLFMPWIVSGFVLVSIMTTSGYLLQAMVDEKENRMMEILATSTRPEEIMLAKILALILVGMTQLGAWSFLPVVGVFVVSSIPSFANAISLDWKTLAYILLTAFPTYVLFAALMAAIGSMISDVRQGQGVVNLITLALYLPYLCSVIIMNQPNGVIAMILSFFPLTASISLLLRMGVTAIPDWQIWLSAAIVVLSAGASLWLAGRIFRLGMLRYGKPLSLRDLLFVKLPAFSQRWLRKKGTA